jgi:hypothetical protein
MEMWLPTTTVMEPDCSPALHPPIVISYHPDCAIFKNNMAVRADCSSEENEMQLHLYRV